MPAPTDTPAVVPGIYGPRVDTGPNGEPIEIPAVKPAYLTERNQRQRVPYNGPEAPGTIVVDPYARVLYDVLEGGVNASLNLDGHGKTQSFRLLSLTVRVPRGLLGAAP